MVRSPSIFIEQIMPLVTDKCASNRYIEVNIAIRVSIAKSYAVPFSDVA